MEPWLQWNGQPLVAHSTPTVKALVPCPFPFCLGVPDPRGILKLPSTSWVYSLSTLV